jgi:hypothetical protein
MGVENPEKSKGDRLVSELDTEGLIQVLKGYFSESSEEEKSRLEMFYNMLQEAKDLKIAGDEKFFDSSMQMIFNELEHTLAIDDEKSRAVVMMSITANLEAIYANESLNKKE